MQFEQKCNIPQIIGCIDGTHIPILAPEDGFRDYVNRKGWPSYNVQAVVDPNGRFRNVVVRHPGSVHDAKVFKESAIFINSSLLIPQECKNVAGTNISFMLVGDTAYLLLPWLMKEYPGSVSPEEESFNVHLSSARVAVEMAFGRLKARWRILLKRMDIAYHFAPQIIAACCVLHNIAEKNRDIFLTNWLDVALESDCAYQQPATIQNRTRVEVQASTIRNHIQVYLAENFPLRKTNMN